MVGRGPRRFGTLRFRHRWRRVDHSGDPPCRAAHTRQTLGGRRQTENRFEQRQGREGDDGQKGPGKSTGIDRRDSGQQDSPYGQATHQCDERGARAGSAGCGSCYARQLGVARRDSGQFTRRCPFDEVDVAGAQLAPRRRLEDLSFLGQAAAVPRHHGSGREEPGGDGQAGGRQEIPDQTDGGHAHDHGDAPGCDHAQEEVLDGVHIVDQAGEKVSPPERRQTRRSEPLQPCVDADPQVGEDPQGGVVPDEALGIAEERPGDSEEPHADDRQTQGDD